MLRKILLSSAILCLIAGGTVTYLASQASPLLLPLYRYDARHDIIPDWLWNRGFPFNHRYRNQLERR